MSDSRKSSSKSRRQRDAGPQGTMVLGRGEVERLLAEAHQESAEGDQAELRAVGETGAGQVFALDRASLLVGRSPDCSITLDDSSVSAEHARLVRGDGGWRVVNLLSTNGTFVNEKRVSSTDLADGDTVRFGRVEFVLHDPESRERNATGVYNTWWRGWLGWGLVAALAIALVIWLV